MEVFCEFMSLSEYFSTFDPKDTGDAFFKLVVPCVIIHIK